MSSPGAEEEEEEDESEESELSNYSPNEDVRGYFQNQGYGQPPPMLP